MPDFPVNYDDIIKRIDAVDPLSYARTRNFLDGAVTYLSPYLSRGVISLSQVKDAVLAKGYEPWQAEKFLQELAWREYYQRVWQEKGELIEADLKQPQADVAHKLMIAAIEGAATGIAAIDAGIDELYKTGYLHNHVRMYTASVACNIAKAHWKQPARWLYYHLLDGDVASNNCSWQWVAGAFSSKKYFCNQENINKYTGTTQTGTFLDKPYHELPGIDIPISLKATKDLALSTSLPPTPLPVIDVEKPTLIYNSYNLDPLWRKDEKVNRVLLLEPSHFEAYPVSEKVLNFIIALSKNIEGIQLYCGGFEELAGLYKEKLQPGFIFKEHPAFRHYRGKEDSRSWMFGEVKGYYPSFFSYWKRCRKFLGPKFA